MAGFSRSPGRSWSNSTSWRAASTLQSDARLPRSHRRLGRPLRGPPAPVARGRRLRDRPRRLGRRDRGDRDRALRRPEPSARGGARAVRRRRERAGHRLRDQRLQEPVCERLREGRRVRRLPVLDEHRRHPCHRRDGEPDPPGRLGGAEGAPQARARPARDAALVDSPPRPRDAARGGRRDPAGGAGLLPRSEDDRRPRRLRRRPRARPDRARQHADAALGAEQ